MKAEVLLKPVCHFCQNPLNSNTAVYRSLSSFVLLNFPLYRFGNLLLSIGNYLEFVVCFLRFLVFTPAARPLTGRAAVLTFDF